MFWTHAMSHLMSRQLSTYLLTTLHATTYIISFQLVYWERLVISESNWKYISKTIGMIFNFYEFCNIYQLFHIWFHIFWTIWRVQSFSSHKWSIFKALTIKVQTRFNDLMCFLQIKHYCPLKFFWCITPFS